MYIFEDRRAKLGKIQDGLQRGSQDLTKGGLQWLFNLYEIKISTLII